MKIKVGIVGATGYAGAELVRLLANHSAVELAALCSVSYVGKKMSDLYPNLYGVCDKTLVDEDTAIAASDVIFASVPHGVSEDLAAKCLAAGKKMIDLGADFRLGTEAAYKAWYGLDYKHPELHGHSVYIIPELMRDKYEGQPIIANPGCYPTSVALGLAPAMKLGLVCDNSIVIDSKSGVTGAGRGLTQNTHYPDCNEAFSPYKIASHRHTPEIEETLSALAGKPVAVTFTPHLLPVNRGIVSTIYATATEPTDAAELHELYTRFYEKEPFVRVVPLGMTANLKNVRMSNYCDISVHYDARTQRIIIVSTIDNMVKGAAGQAVQNMNIMFGQDERAGLHLVAPAF